MVRKLLASLRLGLETTAVDLVSLLAHADRGIQVLIMRIKAALADQYVRFIIVYTILALIYLFVGKDVL